MVSWAALRARLAASCRLRPQHALAVAGSRKAVSSPGVTRTLSGTSASAHSRPVTCTHGQSFIVRVLPALDDNFMFLLFNRHTRRALAVDPVQPASLVREAEQLDLVLDTVLTTHHHHDHDGGNAAIQELVSDITVYGGDERIDKLDTLLQPDATLDFDGLQIKAINSGGHTHNHVSFYVTDPNDPSAPGALFAGDSLFVGGCGRLFEGTADDLFDTFARYQQLPSDTVLYCGHEYTVANLEFALDMLPSSSEIQAKLEWARERRSQQAPTVPSTLGAERQHNLFFQCATSQDLADLRAIKDAR